MKKILGLTTVLLMMMINVSNAQSVSFSPADRHYDITSGTVFCSADGKSIEVSADWAGGAFKIDNAKMEKAKCDNNKQVRVMVGVDNVNFVCPAFVYNKANTEEIKYKGFDGCWRDW